MLPWDSSINNMMQTVPYSVILMPSAWQGSSMYHLFTWHGKKKKSLISKASALLNSLIEDILQHSQTKQKKVNSLIEDIYSIPIHNKRKSIP